MSVSNKFLHFAKVGERASAKRKGDIKETRRKETEMVAGK